jgi:hypothetical protein
LYGRCVARSFAHRSFSKPKHDRFTALPDDILELVVDRTLENAVQSWPSNDRFLAARSLSQICSRLRAIVISQGRFWNYIYLKDTYNSGVIDLTLARVRDVPMVVYMETLPSITKDKSKQDAAGPTEGPWHPQFTRLWPYLLSATSLEFDSITWPNSPPAGDTHSPTPSITSLRLMQTTFGSGYVALFTERVTSINLYSIDLTGDSLLDSLQQSISNLCSWL